MVRKFAAGAPLPVPPRRPRMADWCPFASLGPDESLIADVPAESDAEARTMTMSLRAYVSAIGRATGRRYSVRKLPSRRVLVTRTDTDGLF